jgi:hypothetical protein
MMGEFTLSDDGYPRIYTIHSQKGGVGKTSISLAIAGMSAAIGHKTLIIDGDMTGSSIADVPGMKCDGGDNFNKLILAKPNDFLQYTATWPSRPESQGKNLEEKFCRQMPNHDSVYFIPSSAAAADVESIVPLIAQEDHLHFFRHRIEDILAAAIQSDFKTIILDHSPGLFGFSKATLQMCLEWGICQDKSKQRIGHLLKKCPKVSLQALLVSSFEPHDYKAVLASFQYIIERLSDQYKKGSETFPDSFSNSFRFVFNKAPVASDSLVEIEKMFIEIGNISSIVKKWVYDHEKEFGPQLAPLIDNFGLGDICSNANAFIVRREFNIVGSEWDKWFSAIACRTHLIKARESRDDERIG